MNAFEIRQIGTESTEKRRPSMDVLTNREHFLASTEVVNWEHPEVRSCALSLAGDDRNPTDIARRCFEWVRDEIQHCIDFRRELVTCNASDVLAHRTGFCYAKSHLLAALLRANNIPAGFCYQRLSIDGAGPPFSLHGLNAVWLREYGWYRIDPRGNRSDVAAEFTPPYEQLAFAIKWPGEFELPGVLTEPLPQVVETLRRYDSASALAANLPDLAEPMSHQK